MRRTVPRRAGVRLLFDRVDIGPGGADVRLKLEGLASLARDLGASPAESAQAE